MEAARPRKQQLTITTKALAEPAFAVIRVSWFKNGRECDVDEVQLEDGIDNVEAVLEQLIKNALQAGADVSVITTAAASQFAVDQ
jgi:peptide subunit release factor 1 (eRF1)